MVFRKFVLSLIAAAGLAAPLRASDVQILNASYDVTRELYKELNPAFAKVWKEKSGDTLTINQSHGGSSKQVRSVIEGLQADVITMNQDTDVDAVAKAGLIPLTWRKSFPDNSAPYTSTIIFLVRKGNPRHIKDWDDLVKTGVSVVIPNPKTSGNGRYSYLAAWGYALKKFNGDENKTKEFVKALFQNVPVLDTGGRGATTTFAQRGIGDALLTFEAEVYLIVKELGKDQFDIVYPSKSILAEAPVAVVQKVAARRGTKAVAEAYLQFHYTQEAQEILARNYYRPRNEQVAAKYSDQFVKLDLLTVNEIAGGWEKALKTHFADGGVFDQIYVK
jgi:sulfate/thiosulfate-binding protein